MESQSTTKSVLPLESSLRLPQLRPSYLRLQHGGRPAERKDLDSTLNFFDTPVNIANSTFKDESNES